jgi:hypothetical protein
MAEAFNPNGRQLVAKKIYCDATPAAPERSDRVREHSINVVLASGPFTPSDNLDYEPLKDVLAYVVKNRPHVAVLSGPFVDARHAKVAAGDTGGKTYQVIIRNEGLRLGRDTISDESSLHSPIFDLIQPRLGAVNKLLNLPRHIRTHC